MKTTALHALRASSLAIIAALAATGCTSGSRQFVRELNREFDVKEETYRRKVDAETVPSAEPAGTSENHGNNKEKRRADQTDVLVYGDGSLKKLQLTRRDGKILFSDIYQRAILAGRRDGKLILCAEPSPEGLGAISEVASLDVSAKTKAQLAVALAAQVANTESGAYVGLRTQSIQLMRDSMFRLCEGYLAGAIEESSFETLHRRFQQSMVAILAIEQLTGAVAVPPATLSGTAGLGADPKVILDIATQLSETRTRRSEAKEALEKANKEKETTGRDFTAAQTAFNGTKEGDAGYETAKQELANRKTADDNAAEAVANAQARVTDLDSVIEAYETALAAARSGSLAATQTAQIFTVGSRTQDLNQVAKAVQGIATTMLERPFVDEVCASLMNRSFGLALTGPEQTLLNKCYEFAQKDLDMQVEKITAEAERKAFEIYGGELDKVEKSATLITSAAEKLSSLTNAAEKSVETVSTAASSALKDAEAAKAVTELKARAAEELSNYQSGQPSLP